MNVSFLKVQDLRISFSGDQVIKKMNFEIQKNTLTTFLGPSGSGKTTVLRAIAGLNRQIEGKILLDGKEIQNLAVNQRGIGMIFQSYALFPNLTVFENIAYGLRAHKETNSVINEKVNRMLDLVGLKAKRQAYPNNLSGGQKQRVAIARAMVLEPKLLLLDEPLSALDAKIRVELRNQIRQYQKKLGITMLFVTHDQTEAMAISDNVIVMNDGQLQQQGTPIDIYTHPVNEFMAKFIGNHNVLTGSELEKLGISKANQAPLASDANYIIRPELFSIDHSKGATAINGRIESLAVLGDRIRYQFKTDSGLLLKLEALNQSAPLAVDAKTTIYLNGQDIVKVGS